MPTTAPKPAPPPAAKPAPASPAALEACAPVPPRWHIRHQLAFDKHLTSTQTIEALATDDTGIEVRTGPLIVQPDPDAIRAAMALLDDIIMGHIVAAMRQPPRPEPIQIQQPAPIEIAAWAPAEPSSDGPATPESIDHVLSCIAALNDEWRTYVLESFRIEFNLPADQKLSTRIKSTRHVEFILGMLPS